MKKILLMFVLAGITGVPLCAQETPPEGEKEKSTAEMLEELHKLMKDASKEMETAEKELAKASLPASKADVTASRVKELREKMARGEITEIPEGLREFLRANADTAAALAGKSEEEFKKIVDDPKQLEELLRNSPELLKKLAKSDAIMDSVLEHQHKAEKKLEEVLKKQNDSADKAEKHVDEAVEMAVKLKGS